MARNLKKEYIKKLLGIETANGYKFDVVNYIYNPALNHEYPNLTKVLSETEHERKIACVYYQKHYDGTGEYIYKKYNQPKESDNSSGWVIVRESNETLIEANNRFNLNKLIQLAEQF